MNQSVRSFKRNIVESRFTPIVIALLAIIMRVTLFLTTKAQPQDYPTSFIWDLIAPFLSNPWISMATGTISIFTIAYIISQLNLRFSLIRFRTALPFSLLVFLFSVHPLFLAMSPNYISIIFILFAFFPLLHSYQHHSPKIFDFKSGVLIALAAIFQSYALILFPLFFYGGILMHGFRLKSLLALLFGFVLVFWNLAGVYFIFYDIQSITTPFFYFGKIELILPQFSLMKWIGIGLLILLSGVFVALDAKVFRRERVLAQKFLSFIILIIICSFLLNFIYWRESLFFVYLILALNSFIISHYYSHTSSKWQVYSFKILFWGFLLFVMSHIIDLSLFT